MAATRATDGARVSTFLIPKASIAYIDIGLQATTVTLAPTVLPAGPRPALLRSAALPTVACARQLLNKGQ